MRRKLPKEEKGIRRMPKKLPAHLGNDPSPGGADQRRAYRIRVALPLRYSGRDRCCRTGAGLLADLSETGCRVHTTYLPDIGTSLALLAELPHPVLITEARVVWVADQWIGLEFLRVSPSERTRLRHFLWKHISRATVEDQRPLFSLVSSSSRMPRRLKSIS